MRGTWGPAEAIVSSIEHDRSLDAPATRIAAAIERLLPTGPTRDLLHGVWLGHPLHPMLTDLPIGAWTSAMLVDVVGGPAGARAAQGLIGFGCLTALPTAASGAADWSRSNPVEQRVGLVHAAANTVALGLYTWSWLERRRGRRARGIAISFAAATAATAGGFLGGHLAFRRSLGANRAVDVETPAEWTAATLRPGTDASPTHLPVVEVDDITVLIDPESSRGIAARCSHEAGPLEDGEVQRIGPDRCAVCPWHGSTFRLTDGSVVHGPATSPQPTYAARRTDAGWQVRSGTTR